MGAWGVAIFADDLASDVRGDWREAVIDGADPNDATNRLEAAYAAAIADPDDSIVFWLALAAAQMETGRLVDFVRDRALAAVVDHQEGPTPGERHPVVELLLWDANEIPDADGLARLPWPAFPP